MRDRWTKITWCDEIDGEEFAICDLWRRFSFSTRDQAWSLRAFVWQTFYSSEKEKASDTDFRDGTESAPLAGVQFSSVAQPCPTLCDPIDSSMPGFPSTPRACSNSRPSSRWCHPTIPSSVVLFSPSLLSCPASGSFPMRPFFASGSHSTAVSASESVLPVNIQDWFPLGWTGWISLQSKGLSRVFSNTTVWKCQFFGTQLSLPSNSHIHVWLLEKP